MLKNRKNNKGYDIIKKCFLIPAPLISQHHNGNAQTSRTVSFVGVVIVCQVVHIADLGGMYRHRECQICLWAVAQL